mmetsp:Transcript_24525/g.60616  ORF Transcript_24525/g.60616 Transcript_24525/m.60616 type:complete len:218 (-) Transcript_24525:1501-2154(-)
MSVAGGRLASHSSTRRFSRVAQISWTMSDDDGRMTGSICSSRCSRSSRKREYSDGTASICGTLCKGDATRFSIALTPTEADDDEPVRWPTDELLTGDWEDHRSDEPDPDCTLLPLQGLDSGLMGRFMWVGWVLACSTGVVMMAGMLICLRIRGDEADWWDGEAPTLSRSSPAAVSVSSSGKLTWRCMLGTDLWLGNGAMCTSSVDTIATLVLGTGSC